MSYFNPLYFHPSSLTLFMLIKCLTYSDLSIVFKCLSNFIFYCAFLHVIMAVLYTYKLLTSSLTWLKTEVANYAKPTKYWAVGSWKYASTIIMHWKSKIVIHFPIFLKNIWENSISYFYLKFHIVKGIGEYEKETRRYKKSIDCMFLCCFWTNLFQYWNN